MQYNSTAQKQIGVCESCEAHAHKRRVGQSRVVKRVAMGIESVSGGLGCWMLLDVVVGIWEIRWSPDMQDDLER
jgi:hypothetical protein